MGIQNSAVAPNTITAPRIPTIGPIQTAPTSNASAAIPKMAPTRWGCREESRTVHSSPTLSAPLIEEHTDRFVEVDSTDCLAYQAVRVEDL